MPSPPDPIHRVDHITSLAAAFVQIWHVEPPLIGVEFTVEAQEWNADYTERHIYQWEAA